MNLPPLVFMAKKGWGPKTLPLFVSTTKLGTSSDGFVSSVTSNFNLLPGLASFQMARLNASLTEQYLNFTSGYFFLNFQLGFEQIQLQLVSRENHVR